eukprot:9448756-Pyramimonas_sp.AAC.1
MLKQSSPYTIFIPFSKIPPVEGKARLNSIIIAQPHHPATPGWAQARGNRTGAASLPSLTDGA